MTHRNDSEAGYCWRVDHSLTKSSGLLLLVLLNDVWLAPSQRLHAIQVHLDTLPHGASPTMDDVFSPLSSGLHRLHLDDQLEVSLCFQEKVHVVETSFTFCILFILPLLPQDI